MVSPADPPAAPTKRAVPATLETKSSVVIRFAGDSGDGMQLTGTEFTRAAAVAGNDIATFPDFPAEIRAPAGTLAGVSGYQLHFSSDAIFTPGDAPDVLVAMNPAALKANMKDVKRGGMIVANSGAFNDQNLEKVGYKTNPLEDGSLADYRLVAIDMGTMVTNALQGLDLSMKEVGRSKNYWALGLVYWLYNKPTERQVGWITEKFAKKPDLLEANIRAFNAGWAFGETTEIFGETYEVPAAKMDPGVYRNIMGNQALAAGLAVAAQKAGLNMLFAGYPITPASDILHSLAKFRSYGITTFQAEDEIAAMGATIGASYGGSLGVTATSGPGLALKAEAIGLALVMELPVVIIDVQRGGPSTGLPTKTEQSDLMQAMYGRNGEAPVAVIAAQSPIDCFDTAVEAVRTATKYMTPVILLSDGYIANGAEPWKVPDPDTIAPIEVNFRKDPTGYQVYARNEQTLAREWVKPGTPGLEHRVGGLEKDFTTGAVSYDAMNHQRMVDVRQAKIDRIQQDIPKCTVEGGVTEGDLLVIGWGGTYGALKQAVLRAQGKGKKVGHLHIRWLNPFPKDLGDVMKKFKQVLVCELNKGQLWRLLRAEYLVPAKSYTKVQGKPFAVSEIEEAIDAALDSRSSQ
jgi:2-oxoglutarate/2-oxoacid ferredoxin oxidoreductase subunit alpha